MIPMTILNLITFLLSLIGVHGIAHTKSKSFPSVYFSSWAIDKITLRCSCTTSIPSSLPTSPQPTSSPSLVPTTLSSERPTLSVEWELRGSVINGAYGDNFGESVGLTNDGTILAVGGENMLGIYEFQFGTNVWVEVYGDKTEKSVKSVSLASAGKKMVFGDVGANSSSGSAFVLSQNNDSTWSLTGGDEAMIGEKSNDKFGYSTSITDEGDLITVGSAEGEYCKVFGLQDGTWSIKKRLSNENEIGNGSKFGSSVSMAQDGSKLIVGAPEFDDPDTSAGMIVFYDLTSFKVIQIIKGTNRYHYFGCDVSMSRDGSRVVVGTKRYFAKIYSLDGNGKYTQLSNDLGGKISDASTDFGRSVSISGDGTSVAVGARQGFAGDLNFPHGVTFLYAVEEDRWSPMRIITGKNFGEYFGYSVSLSADGQTVANGIIGRGDKGAVEVYESDRP